MIKNCLICSKEFYTKPSRVKIGKGKFCSKICFDIDQRKNPRNLKNKAYQWKGDNAGYVAKHKWLKKRYGSPMRCELCSKSFSDTRKIYWANKSGLYKREKDDWIRLCVPCHKLYDLTNSKLRKFSLLYSYGS